MSSYNHQRAVTETTALRVTRRESVGFNQLTGVNLSAAARTRTLTKTSVMISGTCPHGDRHFNVKGRGPVSISTDLKAVSVKHRLLYMSTSIECYCCTVTCREFRRGKVSEMSGPLPYASGERPLVVDYGVAVTHQVGNIIKSAVLIIEVALMKRR